MTIQLQQTDTASTHSPAAFCTGLSTGTTNFGRQATSGGTPGVTGQTISYATGGVVRICVIWETAAGEIDSYTIGAGNWVVRFNVSSTGGGTWENAYICRVNSAGTSQNTIGSTVNQAISVGVSGVKTITVSGSADTPSAGDRIVIALGFKKTGKGSGAPSFLSNQLIDTPMTAGGTNVNVSASIQNMAMHYVQ